MPRQQCAAIDGNLQPLVRIERDRIRSCERLEAAGVSGIERRPCAECAVDVQPDAEFGGYVRDLVQRIDGAGVGGAAAGDDRERQMSRLQVGLDRTAQRIGLHAEFGICRDRPQVLRSNAELLDALLDRGMTFGAGIKDKSLPAALQAFGAHVPARARCGAVARRAERVERRHRAARQQQALAAFDGKSDQFHDPAPDADHQEYGRVVVAIEPAIHGRGDGIGQDRDRRRRRVDPGIGPAVPDRDGPGHDLAAKEIEDLFRRLPLLRQWQGHQAKANVRGHDAIDGLMGRSRRYSPSIATARAPS